MFRENLFALGALLVLGTLDVHSRAGDENRTRVTCLEGKGFTIKLHPHGTLIGATGTTLTVRTSSPKFRLARQTVDFVNIKTSYTVITGPEPATVSSASLDLLAK